MKRLAVVPLLLVLGCESSSKDPKKEIREGSEAYAILYDLCNNIGHRLAGTENGRKAEEWALAKMSAIGLKHVHAEPFEHLGWTRGPVTFQVYEPVRKRLQSVSLGNTPGGTIDGEVINLAYGTPADFAQAGTAVKGKIALVLHGAPEGHREVHRAEKLSLAAKAGANAMVLINKPTGGIIQTGTVSIGTIAPIPAVGISREEGDWLIEQLAKGRTRVLLTVETQHGTATSRNIVGEIPVPGSKEIVLLGAHLDSWDLATGAIDNGVGSAVVLETARALVASGVTLKRTVRFVLFMAEELGLLGSKAYVAAHPNDLGQIIMMVNLDMIGQPKGFRLYGCDEAKPFFTSILTDLMFQEDAIECKAGLHSDHQPFMLAGVPAMTIDSKLEEEQSKYYHSAGDHFGLVKREQLDAAARATAITIMALANAEKRPAPQLTSTATRDRMIRDGVQEALQLSGEWPFDR